MLTANALLAEACRVDTIANNLAVLGRAYDERGAGDLTPNGEKLRSRASLLIGLSSMRTVEANALLDRALALEGC